MLAIDGTEPGELKQMLRAAISVGAGIHEERRERGQGIQKTADSGPADAIGLTQREERRGHDRPGISRGDEGLGLARLEQVDANHD